jgi:hypothetical protein
MFIVRWRAYVNTVLRLLVPPEGGHLPAFLELLLSGHKDKDKDVPVPVGYLENSTRSLYEGECSELRPGHFIPITKVSGIQQQIPTEVSSGFT